MINATTLVSRRIYDLFMPVMTSFASNLWQFLSTPLAHWAVLGRQLFRDYHCNRMSQRGNCGWKRLQSSTMITVSRTWWCTKCTCNTVHVAALPWHPSTGHSNGPVAWGRDTWYVWGYHAEGGRGGSLELSDLQFDIRSVYKYREALGRKRFKESCLRFLDGIWYRNIWGTD